MKIDFSSPVIRHCFSLRCLPFDTPSQRIELINVDIEPHNMLTETADGFGNRVLTDRIIEPHSKFVAIVEGKASLDFSKREKEELNCIYKYPSQHTIPGEKIIELVSGLGDMANLTALETAQAVSKRIGEVFSYKSGVANINTTAEEALHLGCGVCQDYAHIFLSAARLSGVPARYVAGIQKGTGETHAWAEFYDDGIWVGIDPTNHRMCDETYLALSHGRDFADCGINRGLFIGGGTQTQSIVATVEEI